MIHAITVLTFDTRVPNTRTTVATQNTPWGDLAIGGAIDLSTGAISTMGLNDTDPLFENVGYSPRSAYGAETEQTLTQATTFGSGSSAVTLGEGTPMTLSYYRVLIDGNGNRFAATFPFTTGVNAIGNLIGDRFSILVLPLPRTEADGSTVYPAFDPTASFTLGERPTFGPANYSLTYPPLTTVDCFAAGTLIDTASGPRPVESLRAGDMIVTRDSGLRPLAWVRGTPVDATRLDVQPNLRPIRIRAGALGQGAPARDLIVSPQHRILVQSSIAHRMFGHDEVLVAAKHLLGLPGISVLNPPEGIEYWHLLFDGHEILRANGAWAESLLTGPQAMKGLGPAGRAEVLTLFPELAAPDHSPVPARPILTGREGRKLTERLSRKGRQLVEAL